ncbi:alpha/beta hydrolase fold [Anaeromyxobacter sp. K]|uniref:alpha/beta fold hydrolase n=1 Tax=Anaeromyxobacter sp. (strain K) TaxID=447217 RepID=UPI00015F9F2D|nr:alpha/beta fold hydrolase [Anaeromyxobacter sp. K]ACG74512.1 alpha/beta hydrolase fold [Anaeromyxobacter sp. K]
MTTHPDAFAARPRTPRSRTRPHPRALATLASVLCACAAAGTQHTSSLESPAMNAPARPRSSGYADVDGLRLHYEIRGTGGTPLVLLHGGLHNTALDAPVAERLAAHRQVISVDLQAHGRTADVERPLRFERLADDVAALLGQLRIPQADLLGYSLGGGVALRTAIQHPERVRRLVLVSVPFSDAGWYPEVKVGFQHLGRALAEPMRPSPAYQTYAAIAPNPARFGDLLDKLGELERRPYDWSADVANVAAPTLLVYADADAIRPEHVVQLFQLLGGGRRDAGLDRSGVSKARLAILPGLTHYDVFESPAMPAAVEPFLDAPEG